MMRSAEAWNRANSSRVNGVSVRMRALNLPMTNFRCSYMSSVKGKPLSAGTAATGAGRVMLLLDGAAGGAGAGAGARATGAGGGDTAPPCFCSFAALARSSASRYESPSRKLKCRVRGPRVKAPVHANAPNVATKKRSL